jgi:hypothetical protein
MIVARAEPRRHPEEQRRGRPAARHKEVPTRDLRLSVFVICVKSHVATYTLELQWTNNGGGCRPVVLQTALWKQDELIIRCHLPWFQVQPHSAFQLQFFLF